MRPHSVLAVLGVLVLLSAPALAQAGNLELGRSVVMRAAAVAETAEGLRGSTATITVTTATNGSGHVFLDTFPLTEIDMQGSARLAARVASQVTGHSMEERDFFFVIRSGSQQIGGPSAGATLAVGVIASLNDWEVRDDVLMTGTISPDGTVGPVGGIAQKAAAAAQTGMRLFLFPAGQETVPLPDGGFGNLTAYCANQLHIECRPVADVVEAASLMTDHAIERPPVTGNVTGEVFLRSLDPLSAQLIDAAHALHREATDALSQAPAETPAAQSLAQRLATAAQTLERAQSAVGNGTYYTAASLSFQSSIESHYVREAARALVATDPAHAVEASLMEAAAAVRAARADVEDEPPLQTGRFEALGAAQVRLLESETRLERARTLARDAQTVEDTFAALYEASYAAQRAATAQWWLRLGEGIQGGEAVADAALDELARDTITSTTEEVTYAEAVLRGSGAGALQQSRALLAQAQAAIERGYAPAAVLSAMEASVRASKVLEVAGFGGVIPATKFETARIEAARAIQGARERGVESFVAQSAYEFGLSVEDPYERLVFLGYARMSANLAGLPGLLGQSAQPVQTRFQGLAEPPGVQPVYVAAAFAVGLALGAGAGLSALLPRKQDEPEEPAPEDAALFSVPPPSPPPPREVAWESPPGPDP